METDTSTMISFDNLTTMDPFDNNLTSTNLTSYVYCAASWTSFWEPYNNKVHEPLMRTVCAFGCLTGVANLVVFTRPEMASMPINKILLALAVSDFLYAFSGIFFSLLGLWTGGDCPMSMAVAELLNEFCFMFFHTWSIYLTLTVGLWRLLSVMCPFQSLHWLTPRSASWSISLAILVGTCWVTSMYAHFRPCDDKDAIIHWFDGCLWLCNTINGTAYFNWTHAIPIKMLPCITLLLITTGLFRGIMMARKKRRQMVSKKTGTPPIMKQTSWMLIFVLILFLLTEVPQGVLAFLTAYLGSNFFWECHNPIWKFECFLEYLSSGFNFVVYVSVSRKYRQIFLHIVSSMFHKMGSEIGNFKTKIVVTSEPSQSTEQCGASSTSKF